MDPMRPLIRNPRGMYSNELNDNSRDMDGYYRMQSGQNPSILPLPLNGNRDPNMPINRPTNGNGQMNILPYTPRPMTQAQNQVGRK
ncbi:hypothetical protein WR25_10049 [Diploscapter pachys]|uniref:Uncharacterized protein n=1 Tax=Diploscapter pachys TaxID=2018661 RepID=A0A2A2JAI4_9BILA|nr:hypothetical protein WR25_10049 [Diploscapter pachys]